MNEFSDRLVAEIELPEGIVVIDCEITGKNPSKVNFLLNNSTLDITNLKKYNSSLINELYKDNEAIREFEIEDYEYFIRKILFNTFGENSDITLTKVDTD